MSSDFCSGDGERASDVERIFCPIHRYFDEIIGLGERFGRDAQLFIAENQCELAGKNEIVEGDCVIRGIESDEWSRQRVKRSVGHSGHDFIRSQSGARDLFIFNRRGIWRKVERTQAERLAGGKMLPTLYAERTWSR